MAIQGGVVEGDLGVETLEALLDRAVARGHVDDRERIDLDQIGIVGQHRPDQARGDRHGILQVGAEAELKRHLARLPGLQPEQRVGVDGDDRIRTLRGNLLDLDAALRRAHEQDLPRSVRA